MKQFFVCKPQEMPKPSLWLTELGDWTEDRADARSFKEFAVADLTAIANDAFVWSEVTAEQRARWDRNIAERAAAKRG